LILPPQSIERRILVLLQVRSNFPDAAAVIHNRPQRLPGFSLAALASSTAFHSSVCRSDHCRRCRLGQSHPLPNRHWKNQRWIACTFGLALSVSGNSKIFSLGAAPPHPAARTHSAGRILLVICEVSWSGTDIVRHAAAAQRRARGGAAPTETQLLQTEPCTSEQRREN